MSGRCPVCVLLGKTLFQNWGDAATAGAPGSLWFGSFAPLDAQTRSLYVLSHPPGEPESFSRLLAYPCLLGTCKTRPETAGVLLCMCWLSSPFRAAQNPTKNACKLLAFERRRAGSLCAFLSPVRFAMVRTCSTEPQADRSETPHHARPVSLCGVLRPPIGFLSSRARCARPRALWRAILHTARPFLWVCINQHPQHYSSRPNCTHSTRVSFRYVPVPVRNGPVHTSSTEQPHTEHSQKEFSMSLSACELRILAAPCYNVPPQILHPKNLQIPL